MTVNEALESLKQVIDGHADVSGWRADVSGWRVRHNARKALADIVKHLEWQPMETAPKDRDIVAEVITEDGYVYKVVLSFDKHPALTDVWTSECSSFKQDQILRWKEVE